VRRLLATALLPGSLLFLPTSVFALEAGVRGMYRGSTISGDGQREIFTRGKFSEGNFH
jgi:hypothetical protein